MNESLPDSWQWTTLQEVAAPNVKAIVSGPFGSNIGRRFFVEEGVPVIRGNNLTTDMTRFVDDGFVFVTEQKADELGNCGAFPGDLIFTAAGSLGQVGIISSEAQYSRYIISNKQLRARVDKQVVDPLFAFYWFSSPQMVAYIQQRNTGSSVPLINLSVLRSLPILLPPIEEQRAIARILGTLDDKIELNRRMNETLEALARAIFKSWFVDFDPVRAKSEGRDPGLPKHIADLFPDRFEDSELGEIPAGWRVRSVESLCESITSGGTPARMNAEFWDGGTIPWFKTGELLDGPLLDSKEHITEAALTGSACKLWPAGTILFALYASPTVGRLGVLTRPGTANQAAAGLIAKPAYDVAFLWRLLLQAREKLQSIAVGAAQQNINQGILKSHRVVVPDSRVVAEFSKLVDASDERQAWLAEQSKTLSAIRDALLTRLISDELQVGEAERFVEAKP